MNINRYFVFSFQNGNNNPTRNSFAKCYIPFVEIKDSNALICNKPFFDQSVKKQNKMYEKLIEFLRNDANTTENLLDYLYHQKYYKLYGVNLS